MSNRIFKRLAKKLRISVSDVEKHYDKARAVALSQVDVSDKKYILILKNVLKRMTKRKSHA